MRYVTPADHAAASERDVHHPSQRQAHIKPVSAPLHVITVVSNPMRFASRYRLYQAFAKQVEDAGAILYTVELATRDRHHEITDHGNPRHLQLRSDSTLWHKENMLNLGMRMLPADAEYVAWADADISWARSDWATETVHQLQLHPVVQMFQTALDMGPTGAPFISWTGFAYDWSQDSRLLLADGRPNTLDQHRGGTPAYEKHAGKSGQGFKYHPGYAWAARRETLDQLGGLGDVAVLGAGDHHMAWAMVGQVERSLKPGLHETYSRYWRQWAERARTAVRGNIGYVGGTILHNWHGSKTKRFYQPRWEILRHHQFDWQTDVLRDVQGVLRWSGNKPALERDVLSYFGMRDEDATAF